PGAAMSTVPLCWEKYAVASLGSVAATASTWLQPAGKFGYGFRLASAPSLPAAATGSAPAFQTSSIACWSEVGQRSLLVYPPKLMLMTLAPWLAANSRPETISATSPLPVQSSTFTGRSLTAGASPAAPTAPDPARVLAAAIVPLTCVPCENPPLIHASS